MPIVSISVLKSYFETNDKPTQAQFVDLIDTLASLPANGNGNANITSILVAALQTLRSTSALSTVTFYNVTNAVGSTKVLQVYAIANNTNLVYAVDVATGKNGIYNITSDTFVENSSTPTGDPYSVAQFDASGELSFGWMLYDNIGANSLDVQARIIYDSFGEYSVDWEGRTAYDSFGVPSVDWDIKATFDSLGEPSLNWGTRVAYDSAGNEIIDWSLTDTLILFGDLVDLKFNNLGLGTPAFTNSTPTPSRYYGNHAYMLGAPPAWLKFRSGLATGYVPFFTI